MASTEIYWQLKEAVKNAIIALGLVGRDGSAFAVGDHVYNQLAPDASAVQYPCWIVTGVGETESAAGGNTEQGAYLWLPVFVFLADREPTRHAQRDPDYMAWRKQVHDYFHWRRLFVAGRFLWCDVEQRAILDDKSKQEFQLVASGLLLKFFWEE